MDKDLQQQLIRNLNQMFAITVESRRIINKIVNETHSPWMITASLNLNISINYLKGFYHYTQLSTDEIDAVEVVDTDNVQDYLMLFGSCLGDVIQIYETNNFQSLIAEKNWNPVLTELLIGFYHNVFEAKCTIELQI